MILKHQTRLISLATAFAIAILSANACKKKDSDSDDEATTTADKDDPAAVNSLATAFPTTLALSIFEDEETSLRLADTEDPNAGKSVQEKIDENKDILTGEAKDCFDPSIFDTFKSDADITCYEFDSDMNPATFADRVGQSWGTTDGTDGDGEACLVAFSRQQAQTAIRLVDKALSLVKAMICQGKKNADAAGEELKIPEAGEKLDLKEALQDATGKEFDVSKAKIEVEEGTSLTGETTSKFTSTIVIEDPNGNEITITLLHEPGEDSDVGVLSMSRPASAMLGENETSTNNEENKNELLSIKYDIDKDKNTLNVELRRAGLLNTIESFDEYGLVNFAEIPEDASNSTAHAMNYILFDMDTETSEGSFAYWQNPGGGYNESARGFIFNTEVNSKGKLEGCGISGAAVDLSIREAITTDEEIAPTGWWHPRWSQNTSASKDNVSYPAQNGSKVTKQCFTKNSDGVFEVDTASPGYEMVTVANSGVTAPDPGKIEPSKQK